MADEMEIKQIIDEIRLKPVVPPWPHAAVALGMSRGGIYAAIARGDLDTIRIGRSIKVVTATLRKRLGLEAA
jgi:hypothetical protein